MMDIDKISLELVAEGFVALVREMRATMLKTAYSSILKEGRDFSCALLDGEGQIIAQSEDSPAHIIPLSWQVQEILRTRPEPLRPGDVLMVNDPYTGGTHLNDVALIQPVYFGERRVFFSVVRAHWGDIGGSAPGSVAGSVENIIHEGIRIPAVLVSDQGTLNKPLLDVIWANVRVPQDRIGDFYACISTCCIGERGLRDLAQRRGEEVLIGAAEALLDRAEDRMRRRIADIPPGVYRFEDYIDSDGRSGLPLFLPITITISSTGMEADFVGASPQGVGPMNCSLAAAATGVFIACKGLLDPVGPINQGAFRPIRVTAPERTFLNAQPPAACGGFSEIRRRVTSVTVGALARAVPESLVGDGKGTSNHINIGCRSELSDDVSILYEYPSGGTGGFREADGSHACRHFDEGEFGSIQPIEVVEAEHPLMVEKCELRVDSEGAGLSRGGLGIHREIRILGPRAKLSILSDRNVIPPFGVLGGTAPAPNEFYVRRNGKRLDPSEYPGKVTSFELQRGDVFVALSAGGGGYGNPLARNTGLVRQDLEKGYVSQERARSVYGVIFHNGEVDTEATARERLGISESGVRVQVASVADDLFEGRRRVAAIGADAAASCGANDGDLMEIVSETGAPLRIWLKIRPDTEGIELGPNAREILNYIGAQEVTLRSPFRRSSDNGELQAKLRGHSR